MRSDTSKLTAHTFSFHQMDCVDFLEFQDSLKKMREIDDKIIHTLNVTLPTDSFKQRLDPGNRCKELYVRMDDNYKLRETAIKKCIEDTDKNVQNLRKLHEENPNDFNIMKSLKKEQNKVRMLQTELGVEEVMKDRSLKLYYEKCRSYYKPQNLTL